MLKRMLVMAYSLVCCIAVFVLGSSGDYDPESIVGVWLFEDGDLDDASGNGHDGDFTGGDLNVAEGQFGDALEFTAGGSYVTIPYDEAFATTTASFTAMAWINIPGPLAWQWIVGQGAANRFAWPERSFAIAISDRTVDEAPAGLEGQAGSIHYALVAADAVTEFMMNSPTMVADGEWHHIATTYDKSMCQMYVDGELDGEAAFNLDLQGSAADFMIGNNLTGIIDEVLIADQALSEDR